MKKINFETFDVGIEQVFFKNDIPNGIQIFFGDNNVTFPGLRFEDITSISTVGKELRIEVKNSITISLRSNGWCRWE